MHARIDELLSLRDGEPLAAATRVHIDQCVICTASLRELQQRRQSLCDLPLQTAPTIEFAHILQRAAAAQRQVRVRYMRVAAAVVTFAFIGLAMLHHHDFAKRASVHAPERQPQRVEVLPVAQLVAQSRELDQLFQQLPAPRQVQRVAYAATVARIEQRVQWIDSQLSSTPDPAMAQARGDEVEQQLWRERVNLMDSLVKVRYVESFPQAF
jgi:hypothetical protein